MNTATTPPNDTMVAAAGASVIVCSERCLLPTAVAMMIATSAGIQLYRSNWCRNRMGWGKRPALLLVDVCTAYWTSSSPFSLLGNPAAESAPDSMRRLLAAARQGNVPVLWTQVEYSRPDMADAGLFWHKAKMLDVWKRGDERGLAVWVMG